MHISTITITAIAIILITGSWAEAKNLSDKSGSFINYHAPKQKSKDYYIVVKEGSGDQCSIVAGAWGENPDGMVGTSPYATRQYAKAALKNFPQCTGGEAEESWVDIKSKSKSKSNKSGKSKSDKTQGTSEVAPADIKQP
jgi:hypothetical protein